MPTTTRGAAEYPKDNRDDVTPCAAEASAHVDEVIGSHYDDGFANGGINGDDEVDFPTGGDHEQTMEAIQAMTTQMSKNQALLTEQVGTVMAVLGSAKWPTSPPGTPAKSSGPQMLQGSPPGVGCVLSDAHFERTGDQKMPVGPEVARHLFRGRSLSPRGGGGMAPLAAFGRPHMRCGWGCSSLLRTASSRRPLPRSRATTAPEAWACLNATRFSTAHARVRVA
jgi:hypothetical protein